MKGKKYLHYFFEFAIVFFAVFLGFLADNYREALSDAVREKQYAKSLLVDLQKDSVLLKTQIESAYRHVELLDSLRQLHTLDLTNKSNLTLFYRLSVEAKPYETFIFQPNETTISQLKSTGDMRLIKQRVADAISNYQSSYFQMQKYEPIYMAHAEETFRLYYRFGNMINITGRVKKEDFTPQPLNVDKQQMEYFFNLVNDLGRTTVGYTRMMESQLRLNEDLMSILKEEYDL